jgi:hypothetical protein
MLRDQRTLLQFLSFSTAPGRCWISTYRWTLGWSNSCIFLSSCFSVCLMRHFATYHPVDIWKTKWVISVRCDIVSIALCIGVRCWKMRWRPTLYQLGYYLYVYFMGFRAHWDGISLSVFMLHSCVLCVCVRACVRVCSEHAKGAVKQNSTKLLP